MGLWAAAVAIGVIGGARAPARAASDPAAASAHFERGARSYERGQYDDAIASFQRAYALDPAPILLFNIAQACRRRGDAESALRYYRSYLDAAPLSAPDRGDAQRRVSDLERELARSASRPNADGPSAARLRETSQVVTPPAASAVASNASNSVSAVAQQPPVTPGDGPPTAPPPRWRIGIEAGVAFPGFRGAEGLDIPTSYGGRALAGYLIGGGATRLEAGCALSVAPISYQEVVTPRKRTSTLVGGGARAEVSHALAAGFTVVGELLVGVTWWAGLREGNPFTPDAAAASGPVPMASGRVAVGIRYSLPLPAVFVYLQPAFGFHKPLDGELARGVSAVTSVDLPAGIGYVF